MIWLLAMACDGAPPAVSGVPQGTVALPEPIPTRPWRRMTVPQLDASIRRVTGGIGWDTADGDSHFEALGATLGVPDYLDLTTPEREPTLLFLKFLDDAAQAVCPITVQRDVDTPSAAVLVVGVGPEDTLESQPAAIRAALHGAVLRFHGRDLEAAEAARWEALFERTSAATDPRTAWTTTCVALLTHPDFYTF